MACKYNPTKAGYGQGDYYCTRCNFLRMRGVGEGEADAVTDAVTVAVAVSVVCSNAAKAAAQ